ncbi:MAG: hypothetical protein NXI16_09720 [Alphaproteobacteria bacterium]|nr:hypothetical protein [Alphaproteobacteria bacterium]
MELMSAGPLSSQDVAQEIVDSVKKTWGVDLGPIFANDALSMREKQKIATERLLEAVLPKIDAYHAVEGVEPDLDENHRLMAQAIAQVEGKASGAELEPNISITEHNFKIVRGYEKKEVYNYVYTLAKRFENMAQATTPGQLAIEISVSSLFSIGVAMSKATWDLWRGGQPFLAALRGSIRKIGFKTAIVVVIIILVELFLFFLVQNPKKILGIIYNDTDDNFVVKNWEKATGGGYKKDSNLYMAHGDMVNFPEDTLTGDLDSPKIQLRQRFFFAPNDPDNVLFGGIYFADKKFGAFGAEGIMAFTPLNDKGDTKFAHMFAVPYHQNNRTNMRFIDGTVPNLNDLFGTLYKDDYQRMDKTEHGYRMTATVGSDGSNPKSGGVVGCIATISKV